MPSGNNFFDSLLCFFGIEVLHGSHIGWQDNENYLH